MTLFGPSIRSALALSLLLFWTAAASALPDDITIHCDLTYATAYATNGPGASHSGTIALIGSGSETNGAYTNGAFSGFLPLSGALTQYGDGVLIRDAQAAAMASGTRAGIDAVFSVTNASATHPYDITFNLAVTNQVDVLGTNAYIHSELTIDRESVEIFFSDVESDAIFGDTVDGTNAGSYGALLEDVVIQQLTITLLPLQSTVLALDWTTELDSASAGAMALGTFSGAILLDGAAPTDSDGDGSSDGDEMIAGTDPDNPADRFAAVIEAEESKIALSWNGVAGRLYSIWSTTNLVSGPWIPVATNLPDAPSYYILPGDEPAAFYQLEVFKTTAP